MQRESLYAINRAFKTPRTILSVDVKIERKGVFYDDAVFLKINNYVERNEITMQMHVFDLRAVAHAMKGYGNGGKAGAPFKKFTESGGIKKKLSLAEADRVFYVNIEEYENKKRTLALAHPFGAYSIVSAAETVLLMCDEAERRLFHLQNGGA